MKQLWILLLVTPGLAGAQGPRWNETWVGSDWEVYARALADRGLLGGEPWSARPFAPPTIRAWAAASRDSVATASLSVLRPSISSSYNSGFAWGMSDGPVWQGRGLNAWATAGLVWHFGNLSARIEPLFQYGQNRQFELAPAPGGSSAYVDDMRPVTIDLPQRFGN